MMKSKYLVGIGLLLVLVTANAQRPVINSLSKTSGTVNETIFITGSGFPASIANVQVNFGAGVATVVNASGVQLEVLVPNTATFGPVTVLNKTNGLSGSSPTDFTPSFSGSTFDPVAVDGPDFFPTTEQYTYDLCGCDFDGDGRTDVAVANNGSDSVSLFRNTSTITDVSFERVNRLNSFFTIRTDCDDLNGDGKPDLVFTSNDASATNNIFIYRNTSSVGTINFVKTQFKIPNTSTGAVRNPYEIRLADIDNDGLDDLIIGNETDDIIHIYRNTSTVGGSITFDAPSQVAVSGAVNCGALDVGDLNGDGLADIAVVPYAALGDVYVLRNRSTSGNILFSQETTINNPSTRIDIIIVDVNQDNRRELVTTSATSDDVDIFENTSTGNTVSFAATPTTVTNVANARGLEAADMNGDGRMDINVASIENSVFILENTSSGSTMSFDTKNISTGAPTSPGNRNIAIFDLNGDAKPDIATAHGSVPGGQGNLAVITNRNCLSASISPINLTFCRNQPFTLSTVKAVATYDWEIIPPAAGTIISEDNETATFQISDASVTVQVAIVSTDVPASCSDTITQVFNLAAGAQADASITSIPVPICSGSDFTLSSANAGLAEYQWTLPDGTVTTTTTNQITITDPSSTDAGNYILREKGAVCYSQPDTINVIIDEPPLVSISNTGTDNFCEGSTVTLQVPQYTGFSYRWLDSLGTPVGTGITFEAGATNNYAVEVTNDTSSCATISNSYRITEVVVPTARIDAVSEICEGVEMSFSGGLSTGQSGFPLTYSWNFGDGSSDTPGDSALHAYATAGPYDAVLTVGYSGVNACADTDTLVVTVSASPTTAAIEALITPTADLREKCPEDTLVLRLPASYQSYEWRSGTQIISTADTAIATTQSGQDSVTLTADVVTDVGCPVTGISVTVANYPNSQITISSADAQIVNDTIILDEGVTSVTLTAANGSGLIWTPGTAVSNASAATVTAFTTGNITNISVTGTDGVNGCQTTATVVLIAPGVTPRKSFSPNGDGQGYDCWEVLNSSNLQGCTIYIMDERGRYVYTGDSPWADNCVWNGNIDNGSSPAPEGIYYFILKCEDSDLNRTGPILLAR